PPGATVLSSNAYAVFWSRLLPSAENVNPAPSTLNPPGGGPVATMSAFVVDPNFVPNVNVTPSSWHRRYSCWSTVGGRPPRGERWYARPRRTFSNRSDLRTVVSIAPNGCRSNPCRRNS